MWSCYLHPKLVEFAKYYQDILQAPTSHQQDHRLQQFLLCCLLVFVDFVSLSTFVSLKIIRLILDKMESPVVNYCITQLSSILRWIKYDGPHRWKDNPNPQPVIHNSIAIQLHFEQITNNLTPTHEEAL